MGMTFFFFFFFSWSSLLDRSSAVVGGVLLAARVLCLQTLGAEDISASTCTASRFRFAVVRVRGDESMPRRLAGPDGSY